MNQIKFVLFFLIVLLFSACASFWGSAEIYIGTVNMVKQKDVTGVFMGYFDKKTYSYKLEITTTDGVVLKGEYEDSANKYKPGDFVKVIIVEDKIDSMEILDRAIIDSHY